jgi:LacI family transcriptional regulator
VHDLRRIILLIEKSRSFGRGLLRGIARYSDQYGPWIFQEIPPFYHQDHKSLKKWLSSTDAQGILGHLADPRIIETVLERKLPTVLCNVSIPGQIVTDDRAIGALGAGYFLERGYHSFGYSGISGLFWSEQRGEAFQESVTQAGHTVHHHLAPLLGKTHAQAKHQSALVDWLGSLAKPAAVMACNDEQARDVLRACRTAEITVPNEVAVLGVDNDDMVCNFCFPRLSSIALDVDKAGYEAAACLETLMASQKSHGPAVEVAPLYVVPRMSTDLLAIKDSRVAAAMRYLHQNPRCTIQVGDLAQAAGLSRRSLEQRFQQVLGKSPHEVIRRVRIEQMAQMLIETDLPVAQIAQLLGFSYVRNMARWFKQHIGMSPSAYRAQHRH